MKICFVSRSFPPEIGGASTVAFNTGKRLAKKHEVFIITIGDKNSKSEETMEGMKVKRIKSPFFDPHKTNILTWFLAVTLTCVSVFKLLISKKIDVVHAIDLSIGAPSCLFSKLIFSKTTFVLRYGGDLPYEIACRNTKDFSGEQGIEKSWKLNNFQVKSALFLQKTYFWFFDIITPTTEHSKGLLLKLGIKPEKIFKVKSGVDTTKFKPKEKKEKNELQILSGGRFEKWKQFDTSIILVSKLLQKGFKIKFILFGEGQQENELKKLVKTQSIEEKVFFPGKISHEELAKELAIADIFISTSASNVGISNIVLEAMSSGTVTISSGIPGAREIIKDGEDGFLFNKKNELEQILEKVLKNPKLRNKIGENARQSVISNFNYNGVVNSFLEAYKAGAK